MRASIQARTRSRTPVSIGSIQSSKSRASGSPAGCAASVLLIRSVMAWSPTGPERSNARIPLCGLQHPETTPPSKVYHLPDGTTGTFREIEAVDEEGPRVALPKHTRLVRFNDQ